MSSDKEDRFRPGNRPKAVAEAISDQKDLALCEQAANLHKTGQTDNPVFLIHLRHCENCRKKYSS